MTLGRAHKQGRSTAAHGFEGLVLAVLLPLMFLAAALGGTTTWLHSHGDEGRHVHFFAQGSAEHDLRESLHASRRRTHAEAPRDGHEHVGGLHFERAHEESIVAEHAEGRGAQRSAGAQLGDRASAPPPAGVVIEFARILAVSRSDARFEHASALLLPASTCAPLPQSAFFVDTHQHESPRFGWPPPRGRRSGVAALLRSSHALRI